MRHIFLIDPIEKLNLKKDSSFLMALTAKKMGHDVYLIFSKDLYVTNFHTSLNLVAYGFTGNIDSNFYLSNIKLLDSQVITLGESDILHFRLDPPFDEGYLKTLWLLDFLEYQYKVTVLNRPKGIIAHNEKLIAFKRRNESLPSFVGENREALNEFIREMQKAKKESIVLKPLNSFSGFGVQLIDITHKSGLDEIDKYLNSVEGAVIAQPFVDEIRSEGELRSVYWLGRHIGTILKSPPEGSILANIAQGANFAAHDLSRKTMQVCDDFAKTLRNDGVGLIGFDILGGMISEVNITCPGLLVELSSALGKNVVEDILSDLG